MDAMPHNQLMCFRQTTARRGFTLTELLVVIGIIVLLVALLVPALVGAATRARSAKTESLMTNFSNACESFRADHGRYPGIIPEAKLAADSGYRISGTENALLDLMGGAVRGDHPQYDSITGDDWEEFDLDGTPLGKVKVNLKLLGEGPEIDGRTYAPYFTPGDVELAVTPGQYIPGLPDAPDVLPDLIDAWGQPIVYLRRARGRGPLTAGTDADPGAQPQFELAPIMGYVLSRKLGEMGTNQRHALPGNTEFSVINFPCQSVGCNSFEQNDILAQILRNPAFGEKDKPVNGSVARGDYMLLSSGPDGFYFANTDGPGSPDSPEPAGSVQEFLELGPGIFDEYDDLRVFGGG